MLIPFFAFRIMVGCGLVMLALAWIGTYLSCQADASSKTALLLWADVPQLSAALHRDADRLVHRRGRPPALDGLWRAADRRRADAVPDGARGDRSRSSSSAPSTSSSSRFGVFYIYRLLRAGPVGDLILPPAAAVPNRPMSVDQRAARLHVTSRAGE